MLKSRITIVFFILSVFFIICFSGCGKKVPSYKLEVTSFALDIPNVDVNKYFSRVTDIDITPNNEIVVVDIDGPGILRFDAEGKFINNIAGYGSGRFMVFQL